MEAFTIYDFYKSKLKNKQNSSLKMIWINQCDLGGMEVEDIDHLFVCMM